MLTVPVLVAFVVGGVVGFVVSYFFSRNNPNKVAKIEEELAKLKGKVGL